MTYTAPLPERDDLARLISEPGSFLGADNATTRRIAIAASLNHPELHARVAAMLETDPDAAVRRECAEVLGLSGAAEPAQLEAALADEAAEVREAAATALGEVSSETSVPALIDHARDAAEDKLVREAAVAALGAIGDQAALPTLLELITNGPPQIRRRCVASLSIFDGPEVEGALRTAATDRNPMVREAAEMVVGRTAT